MTVASSQAWAADGIHARVLRRDPLHRVALYWAGCSVATGSSTVTDVRATW
jgi:hypothetical protein